MYHLQIRSPRVFPSRCALIERISIAIITTLYYKLTRDIAGRDSKHQKLESTCIKLVHSLHDSASD